MKLAISGKGGVGKSSLAAALALLMAKSGQRVLAVDADPDANLAAALGILPEEQKKIIPISQHVALIEERTGAKVKQYGQIFKLNPDVSDIAEKYAYNINNIALLVLGAVEQGGSGCACPENVLIRSLISDLILYKDDSLIMDLEAGIEHLGRATARGVDTMIVVVEPGQRSIDCSHRIIEMSYQIGLKDIRLVANKINGPSDEAFIRETLSDHDLLGIIPYSEEIRKNDRNGLSVLHNINPSTMKCFESILNKLQQPLSSREGNP